MSLRTIKTARTAKDINEGAKAGFRPLVKEVKPSPDIRTKVCVLQHKETGRIQLSGDYRFTGGEDYEVVIPFTFYYPYSFPSPFAAYLVPQDLEPGERVLLEDLIEDIVAWKWNQGDAKRLESCEAIWNGEDFEIQFDQKKEQRFVVG